MYFYIYFFHLVFCLHVLCKYYHRKKWLSNTTYSGITKQWRESLLAAFRLCTVTFDGYNNESSTKDIKNQVRGGKLSQIVTIDLNEKPNISQEKFLKNGTSKTMSFLRDNLREYGFNIFEAAAGTDTLIVKVAV